MTSGVVRLLLCVVLCTIIFLSTEAKPTSVSNPKLLVVSYDGFRYDYFDREFTPFLKKLKSEGTYADYMRNVFVTKTFPNHHSIATGLYTETHGVVDSEFYDSNLNKTHKYSKELYHYNNDILPIWTINEVGGRGRRSGTMMWPGGEFEYHGLNVTFTKAWNISTPWEDRIDLLLSWFNHPETPINLGMLYIEEPDFHAHGIGINNARFIEVLAKVDRITEYLHNKLKEKSLEDLNVIHLSDHGMATVTQDRIIDFTKYIESSDYTARGVTPVMNIYPRKGKHNLVYNKLKEASKIEKGFEVYLKEDVPSKYHFSQNSRIGPILIVSKVGYSFQTLRASFPWFEKEFNITINEKSEFGIHGYDNNATEMHPFFFGVGPAFSPKCKVPPFDNIDLLPLFCEVLNLNCNSTNGTLGNLTQCLTKYRSV